MAKYRVSDGTQVHFRGTTHAGGETFEVDPPVSEEANQLKVWLDAGWIQTVTPRARKG